jgi:arylsulfatase A-like enzyme
MSKRPNIVFMIADDHRWNGIHAFGNPDVQTPTLDELVANGVSFMQAHIMGGLTGAVCVPSRALIHTGVHVFHASVSLDLKDLRGLQTLPPHLTLLGEHLRQNGYYTHGVGKWHNDKLSFNKSFQSGANIFFGGMSDHYAVPIHDYDPSAVYPDEARRTGEKHSSILFADAAVDFIRRYDGEQPFFLYTAFTAPHDPRTAPAEYAHLYDPAKLPLPENFLPEHPFDTGDLRGRDEKLAPWPRTPEVVRQHLADYYAMISHLDAQVARVLGALAERGIADETLVIYTADHGLAVGQHGLFGKQNLYEHSIHVPLIVRGPGLPKGKRVDALHYMYDVYPTLCELVDVPVPATVESRSLVPLITGATTTARAHVCSVYRHNQRSVSDGRWKLIRYYRSVTENVGADRLQLFDLSEDPWETRDLSQVPSQQPRIQKLAAVLAAWQRSVDDPLADRPVIPGELK